MCFLGLVKKVKNKSLMLFQIVKFNFLSHRFKIRVLSSIETIKYIQTTGCSVARFGDGELNMILREKNIGFQEYDQGLVDRLKEVLFSDNPNLLICLPHVIDRFDGECLRAKDFWRIFSFNNKKRIYQMLLEHGKKKYVFGDTQMTRPYIDYENAEKAEIIYPELQKLWNRRNILIVEGTATRMGVGNALFSKAASIKRIICPAKNAFAAYDQILTVITNIHSDELVLLALGPAATVLAADLARRGIRALDVGHMDIEYEWFLQKATEKSVIKGKYVNEVSGGNCVEDFVDDTYLNQIVASIVLEGE